MKKTHNQLGQLASHFLSHLNITANSCRSTRLLRLTVLALFFGATNRCLGQAFQKPGYIVNLAGDTIRGLIANKGTNVIYHACTFQKNEGDTETTYQPNEISAYGIENRRFVSKKSPNANESVFLEILVDGTVTLYAFDEGYFGSKGNDRLYSLQDELKEKFVDGKRMLYYNKAYLSSLNMIMFDSPELRERIAAINPREKQLSELFRDYNKIKGNLTFTKQKSTAEKHKIEQKPAHVGVIVGVTCGQLLSVEPRWIFNYQSSCH